MSRAPHEDPSPSLPARGARPPGAWRRRLPRWRRPGRRGVAAIAAALVLVLALGIDTGLRARDIARELQLASADVKKTRGTLEPLIKFDAARWPKRDGYERLVVDLASARGHLARAQSRLSYLRGVAWSLGWVPVLGPQIAAGPRAIDLGVTVTTQAEVLAREGEPLFAGEGRIAERAREVLVVRHERLDAALAALQAAAAEAEELRRVRWTGPLRRAEPLVDELGRNLAQVGALRALTTSAAAGLDPLLGFSGTRTYVVLGQNEQEIRPTGGFVGTMGVITIERGRLLTSEYRSSYDFDPRVAPPRRPPASLVQTMGAGRWFVRDANWDADFPTSAQRILDFLQQDQGIKADGVIAVDMPMIQLLLSATGPMAVEGFDQPLTSANFTTLLEDEIFSSSVDARILKKQLLQPVLRQLISRVQDVNSAGVPAVLSALHNGVQGRHLQVYSRDERSQDLATRLGAAGRLTVEPGHDFLAVVDSNVSWIKIQAAIKRDITYLARADGHVDVLIRWTNELSSLGQQYRRLGQGGELWNPTTKKAVPSPGTFGNYARIYVPRGTTFDEIKGFTGAPGLTEEHGLWVLSGLIVVPNGQTVSLRLSYLPGGPGASRPSAVDIWKQGGQMRDTLRVFMADGTLQHQPFDGPFTKDVQVAWPQPSATPLAGSLRQ